MFLRNTHPRAEMNFIDDMRRPQRVASAPLRHPVLITPLVVEIPYPRCCPWRLLVQQAYGIGLVHSVSVAIRLDVKLVECPAARAGYESFPYAGGRARLKAMRSRIPSVKAAHERD